MNSDTPRIQMLLINLVSSFTASRNRALSSFTFKAASCFIRFASSIYLIIKRLFDKLKKIKYFGI